MISTTTAVCGWLPRAPYIGGPLDGQGDAQSLETRSARVCELYDVIVLR